MNREPRGLSPQTRAKPLFFGHKLNFSARSHQPKMKKNIFYFFLYLLNEKNGIHSVLRDKSARNPGFSLIIIGWGESGKVILQVIIVVFSGTVEKFFGQKWFSPP